ncbi:class A beta-lactamase-related serine hydrolase [Chrysosporum ovalisporum FSS-45]|nr:class A beta-lactamase-related serine hydrolase [Umezakia ovalisporum FSS-45]
MSLTILGNEFIIIINYSILILRPEFTIFWAIFITSFLTFNTCATLIVFGLLIDKVIQRQNSQAKIPPVSDRPKITQSQDQSTSPSPSPSPLYSPVEPLPTTESKPTIRTYQSSQEQQLLTRLNDNSYDIMYNPNISFIPREDYKQVKSKISYTPNKETNRYNYDGELQSIVNDIVNYVRERNIYTEHLSISLINVNSHQCCNYAGHSDSTPRFSASIIKLFWMVYLYGLYQEGYVTEIPQKAVHKMIQDSDNESASLIVDKITGTQSGDKLSGDEFQKWYQKRLSLNKFFQKAGYDPINISQKLFPISYSDNHSPMGRDLQIRKNEVYPVPVRNYTTTRDVARLLLEIEQEKSISKQYSREMKTLLKRSLKKEDWQNKQFNAIEGFLGEGLQENTYFLSKMGWNSKTRNDAAIIGSPDGKHKYILVIFGDDPRFYQDKEIFPEISRRVYKQITKEKAI